MRSPPPAALLALVWAGGALAQAVGVPPIEQEPRPGTVHEREAAAGLNPSGAQERSDQRTVDQLYRDLTGQNPNAATPAPLPPMGGTPRQDAREEDRLYRDLTGQNPNAPMGTGPR